MCLFERGAQSEALTHTIYHNLEFVKPDVKPATCQARLNNQPYLCYNQVTSCYRRPLQHEEEKS